MIVILLLLQVLLLAYLNIQLHYLLRQETKQNLSQAIEIKEEEQKPIIHTTFDRPRPRVVKRSDHVLWEEEQREKE